MHLKRIEIKGFKSFADRVLIEPASGISCIVGPNGSGKSNITDAIRWVLGEQGARVLRGEKMEDLIFSGTGRRASLGFAEVKLSFDNSDRALDTDFNEVEIARRLYRSGESEYRINDSQVRLRDIRELFADTGVGLEGYSIIGQGRIDEIIGAQPEERRLLFDEAAGITAFKLKRAEAERHLEAAERDLEDVRLKLEELGGMAEESKNEAERAELYLAMKERHALLKVAGKVEDYSAAEARRAKLEKKLQQKRMDNKALESEAAEAAEKLAALRESLSGDRARLKELNGLKYDLAEEIRSIVTEILLGDEKRHGLDLQLRQLNEKTGKGEEEKTRKEEEAAALLEEIKTISEREGAIDEEIESIEAMASERDERAAGLKVIIEEFDRKDSRAKSRGEALDTRKHQIEERLLAISDELSSREEGSREELERLEAEVEALSAAVSKGDSEFKTNRQKLDELEGRETEIISSVLELEKNLARLRSERDFHQQALDNLTDYDRAVAHVMKDRPKDVLGVVGQLFKTEKKYEEAVETALGRNVGIIICEKSATAKKYIRELRDKKLGRASFLPMEDLDEKYAESRKLKVEGARTVSELITCDERYKKVFELLLGGILVADDFDEGRKLLKHGKRIVTLKGEIFLPGGVVTGGSRLGKESGGAVSRSRLLDEAERALEAGSSNKEAKEDELRALRAKEDALKQAQKQISEALSENRHSLDSKSKALKTESDARKRALEALNAEKSRLDVELSDIGSQLFKLEDELTRAREEAEASRAELLEIEGQSEERAEALVNLKIEHARVGEQLAAKRGIYEKLSAELEGMATEKASSEEELTRLKAEIAQIDDSKEDLEDAKKLKEERFGEVNAELETLDGKISGFEEEESALENSSEDLAKKYRRASEKALEIEADLIRAESEMGSIESELISVYSMTVDDALEARQALDREDEDAGEEVESLPWTEEGETLSHVEEIERLEQLMEELGDVNLSSIDTYRAICERMSASNAEREEIEKAAKGTRKIIEELSSEIHKRFEEGLENIKGSFAYAFTRLFGGGEARLELTGEGDVLDLGVEIRVQPPGKKLRSISLLSGGEKALTAIALLFAFMEQRPSPFYVLDEIEASLDDVNLLKFTEFLEEYSKRAQFLTITHRRATMDIADSLFGVTMEEYGVSKVFSVKLGEEERYLEG